MRFLTVGLCFIAFLSSSLASPSLSLSDSVTADNSAQEFALLNAWKSFKSQYDKSYETPEIDSHRFSIFVKNLEKSALLNSKEGPNGAKFGITQFMDLDAQEFRAKYAGSRPPMGVNAAERLRRHHVIKPTEIVDPEATNIDWRLKGAVSPVKDQGQCGSCWAFSATEEVESMWFMKHGHLPILSPQQIVDCDTKGQDQGCNGGWPADAYAYVKPFGLDTEASYPYQGVGGTCQYSASNVAANITGFTYATPPCSDACTSQDEGTLLNNLASHGPISICVDSAPFQTYVSGVYTNADASCASDYSDIDHCVQLIGYQSASPNNYWIIKNSWNTSWGNAGYIYVAYGSNICGLADQATIATSA